MSSQPTYQQVAENLGRDQANSGRILNHEHLTCKGASATLGNPSLLGAGTGEFSLVPRIVTTAR
jgi:hypothetical protein